MSGEDHSFHYKNIFELLKINYKENLSQSYIEQDNIEKIVLKLYQNFEGNPKLLIHEHVSLLRNSLHFLGRAYECYDASQVWLLYWIVHSLILLGQDISAVDQENIIKFLKMCQINNGGFGGGPQQISHLAPSYAAVNTLCSLKNFQAYEIIDRENLQTFLFCMKQPDGSFTLNEFGEVDIRGAYCAASIAHLLNLNIENLFDKTAEWIVSCQTYEGGFGCLPGCEAHGGYTFCGIATLVLLNKLHLCDVQNALRWLVNRQRPIEGGFNGRTNKLVDSCYSFWVGAVFPLLMSHLDGEGNSLFNEQSEDSYTLLKEWIFDSGALQEYLLICCQDSNGSLIDKPGKAKDIYHTCYALSGLSIAQHPFNDKSFIIGDPENELKRTHPIFNIVIDAVIKAKSYFSKLPKPHPVSSI